MTTRRTITDPYNGDWRARHRAENGEDMGENEIIRLTAAFKAKARPVIQRINEVSGDAARKYPAAYVAEERAQARAELATLERTFLGQVAEAHHRQIGVADETYAMDPRDPASITADELQIQRLARLHPDRTSARNHLLPEARRFAAVDPAKARVYLEAARLAGAVDGQAERAVGAALDKKLPNRVAALEARHEAIAAYAEAQIAASTTLNLAAAITGDRTAAARASISAKNAAIIRSDRTGTAYQEPVGLVIPSGAPGQDQA